MTKKIPIKILQEEHIGIRFKLNRQSVQKDIKGVYNVKK
jgi:hypothetical protein